MSLKRLHCRRLFWKISVKFTFLFTFMQTRTYSLYIYVNLWSLWGKITKQEERETGRFMHQQETCIHQE